MKNCHRKWLSLATLLLANIVLNNANAEESTQNHCPNLNTLLNDPAFIAKVAHKNGLNSIRFNSQETPSVLQQAKEYALEQKLCTNVNTKQRSQCVISLDLLNDQSFIERVARQNGLTSMRFYSLETETQRNMVFTYSQKKGLCQ